MALLIDKKMRGLYIGNTRGNTVLAESLGRKYEKRKRKTGKIRNKKNKRKDVGKMGSISMKIMCKMAMKIKTKSVLGVISMYKKEKISHFFGGRGRKSFSEQNANPSYWKH